MKKKACIIAGALAALTFTSPISAQSSEELKALIAKLQAENEALRARQKSSDATVPRGTPANVTARTITVFVPENASNIKIQAFMKNEPWGGAQSPPKDNTDDLGSSHLIECPVGSGECPIGWSRVGAASKTSLPNGRTRVQATFYNWAHRNDRTGQLKVTYQRD